MLISNYWKLMHKLFKWEFVHALSHHRSPSVEVVRRVHYTADGEPYIIWKRSKWVFLARRGVPDGMMLSDRPIAVKTGELPMSADGSWIITPLTPGLEAKMMILHESQNYSKSTMDIQ